MKKIYEMRKAIGALCPCVFRCVRLRIKLKTEI